MRSRTSLWLLVVLTSLSGHAAQANTREIPIRMRVREVSQSVSQGSLFSGILEIRSTRPIDVGGLSLRGQGWVVHLEKPPDTRTLARSIPLNIPFTAIATDRKEPLTARLEFEGQVYERRIDLSPEAMARASRPASAMKTPDGLAPAPSADASTARALPSPTFESGPIDPSRHPAGQRGGEQAFLSGRDIRVHGGFAYLRHGDNRLIGADGVRVEVLDEDSFGDELLATGITNALGEYDLSFHWDPCFLCFQEPDLYVRFETENSRVVVQDSTLLENNYAFVTSTTQDYEGTSLDMGWWRPVDGSDGHAALGILTDLVRAWRLVLLNEGLDIPQVDAQWPDDFYGTAFYNPVFQEIHLETGDAWREDTHVHEYGHHWVNNFGNFQLPNYCSFDDPPPDCEHSMWCEENPEVAYTEGWPDWFSDVVTRSFSPASLHFDNAEEIGVCQGSFDNAYETEGIFAALLRDIEDPATPPNQVTGSWWDDLGLGIHPIFEVARLDQPISPAGFIAAFRARYPEHSGALCRTANHNRYDLPDTQAPGAAPGLAVSLPIGTCGLGLWIPSRVTWGPAPDDCSGIAGYSILLSDRAELPDAIVDIGPVNSFRFCPTKTGVFNIRAVDREGKWSTTFASTPYFAVRSFFDQVGPYRKPQQIP
jgi:hypothetical protein